MPAANRCVVAIARVRVETAGLWLSAALSMPSAAFAQAGAPPAGGSQTPAAPSPPNAPAQPPDPAVVGQPPVLTFGADGLTLDEALRLTLRHEPNIQLGAANLDRLAGVTQEQGGIFDLTLIGTASYEYRIQELTETRKQAERNKRERIDDSSKRRGRTSRTLSARSISCDRSWRTPATTRTGRSADHAEPVARLAAGRAERDHREHVAQSASGARAREVAVPDRRDHRFGGALQPQIDSFEARSRISPTSARPRTTRSSRTPAPRSSSRSCFATASRWRRSSTCAWRLELQGQAERRSSAARD